MSKRKKNQIENQPVEHLEGPTQGSFSLEPDVSSETESESLISEEIRIDHLTEDLSASNLEGDSELAEGLDFAEYSEDDISSEILVETGEASEGFLPEVTEEDLISEEDSLAASQVSGVDLSGTELDSFESAAIEEEEFIEEERLESIIESVLFASDRPVSLASIKMVFKGTNVRGDKIKRALDRLSIEYAGSRRGVTLEEVTGGYQLRTKIDNLEFLRGNIKAKSFKLSGPALEVLSIAAYKQPVVKSEIDEIRGVESGHLLRALMEKGLVNFEGKSDLPGRPMQYGTTRKFLEIFGLRNLKELPTLSQIDELLPEGIGEEDVVEKQKLSDITDSLSEAVTINSYSQGEDELLKIQNQLEDITTSSDFFEQEKIRQKQQKDRDKAQNIREALAVGELVPTRDQNWLKRYDEALANGTIDQFEMEKFNKNKFKKSPESTEDSSATIASDATESADAADSSDGSHDLMTEGLFEEDAPHMEDELPFTEEADEIDEGGPSEMNV